MHHNILAYWRHLETLPPGHEDRPSPRVCRLLTETFEKWRSQPAWLGWDELGHLFDGAGEAERRGLAALPVAERKGLAVKRTLEKITEPEVARRARTFEIHPDELILGTMPPYSVGQGKELMLYLTEEEALAGELAFLNERSPFGHVTPSYHKLLSRGVEDILAECRRRRDEAGDDTGGRAFYQGAIHALEGVLLYAGRYAELARATAGRFGEDDPRHRGMLAAAERLTRVPAKPPRTLLEACQSFFLVHSALHFTGDVSSIGRLDQLLWPFYAADREAGLSREEAQEVLDCLWLKLDDKVILDHRHMEDRFTSSDATLLGAPGASNYDQGSLANQWMQQVTLGGVVADDDPEPKDAANELTYLCLASSRRLPLNSPTLDLRVHKETPRELLTAAARTMLSGGAHPILLNDDLLIPALHRSGESVRLASARNYACDGCYETHFMGETEFSFGYIPAMDALEKALNSGAGLGSAGALHLRGAGTSWRTKPAAEIAGFEDLWEVLTEHVRLGCHRFWSGVLAAYGSKEAVCPTPLLSALMEGCLESGRDLYGGGARTKMFAPLMTGISTAADSLYVIRHLVFEEEAFTLEELVGCLRANWGDNPEVVGLAPAPGRIAEIRDLCRAQPKFGHGVAAVDELAWRLIETFCAAMEEVRNHPMHAPALRRLEERYGTPEQPFEILLTPGVGTFEQYVFGGIFVGASPDASKALAPVASDLSAAPVHPDEEPVIPGADGEPAHHVRETPLYDALASWDDPAVHRLSDGAPADFNVREDFPEDELVAVLERFARGEGGNVMTVTAADPETFLAARTRPADHELVRVRMGGWTELFITLFPVHKAQHRRRPLYIPRPRAPRDGS